MKHKILSLLLVLTLTLPLAPPALALGSFADVSDAATARNVEVLQLMGVINGDGGSFRPHDRLTRAEFCKMAVELQGRGDQVVRYRSRTVFPDVRASHWAAGYINLATAADKDAPQLIHGNPDGTFAPDRNISYGEAVTVLVRALGYTDQDTGGIWPDGYVALAGEAGMTKGLTLSGNAPITRAQAAQLFVNALTAKNGEGVTLLAKLGYAVAAAETTLYSVDAANGKLRTSGGEVKMANPMASTALNGLKGHVVTKNDEAVTFLPVTNASGGAVSDAAIIVAADGSTAGIDALTGGAANYTIYRNGVRASKNALKKNDVLTYNAANNIVQACDTRVAVYYENCTPTPGAATAIEALGGTSFSVLPTAQQSLARFRPGQTMVILLTADGQVAGAVENGTVGAQGNAFGYVNGSGAVSLICGGNLIPLKCSGAGSEGKAVRIAQNSKTGVYVTAQTSGVTDALDLASRTLGARKLADNVLVFKDGEQTSLEALGVSRVERNEISYVGTNSAGEVTMLVLGVNTGREIVGRVIVSVADGQWVWNAGKGANEPKVSGVNGSYVMEDGETYWEWKPGHGSYAPKTSENGHYTQIRSITIDCGANGKYGPFASTFSVDTGDIVSAELNAARTTFINMTRLDKLGDVPASAWVGRTAVNYGGRTYTVPSSVLCWNRNNGTWFDKLETALDYGGKRDIYVKDGVVRVIEIRA